MPSPNWWPKGTRDRRPWRRQSFDAYPGAARQEIGVCQRPAHHRSGDTRCRADGACRQRQQTAGRRAGSRTCPAIGMCGGDGLGFPGAQEKAQRRRPRLTSAKSALATAAGSRRSGATGGVPVFSSIALGSDGEYYNINADQMAAACAVACRANALIFLTDVAGVKGADGSVMRWLNTTDIPALSEGLGRRRRHASQTASLPGRLALGRGTRTDFARGRGRSSSDFL